MILKTISATVAVVMMGSCAAAQDEPRWTHKAVVSAWPLADLIREVLPNPNDSVEVISLASGAAEPHDVELTASDLAEIRGADVMIYVGGGFQPAVERAADAERDVAAIDHAGPTLRADEHEAEQDEKHHDDHADDPHVWLDPHRWAGVARAVGGLLAERLEEPSLSERAEQLATRYEELDHEYETALSTCRTDLLLTEHAAFGYLADRYGLEEQSLTGVAKEAETTAPAIRRLRDLAREAGSKVVFSEPGSSGSLAETLAAEAGLEVLTLDPLEVEAEGSYEDRMHANLAALVQGLEC